MDTDTALEEVEEEYRQELEKIGYWKRHRYTGTFEKYGFKYSDHNHFHPKPTLLLKDIYLIDDVSTKKMVTDHLWFNLPKCFEKLGILVEGEEISFDARVDSYYKGYDQNNRVLDYKLVYPTKVQLEKPLLKTCDRSEWTGTPRQMAEKVHLMYLDYYNDKSILDV